MQYAAQAYFQTQVGTTGQGELVVLLYDGALRFLAQAREKMLLKDVAAKGTLISKAMDVVNELDASLNMEVGGDVAQNLRQLYFICSTRMMMANLKLDVAMLDSVVNILGGLRSAFAQILTQPEAQAAAASISQRQSPAASARPLSSATPAPVSARIMASQVYAQQSVKPENGPRVFQALSVQPPAPPRPTTLTPPLVAAAMAKPLAAPVPAAAPQNTPTTPAPAAPEISSPAPAPAPAQPLAQEGGFAGRRLAAYSRQLA